MHETAIEWGKATLGQNFGSEPNYKKLGQNLTSPSPPQKKVNK